MKVIEFVEYMKKNANKVVKEEQLCAMVRQQLDVKDYLSIKAKRALIDDIINSCVLYDNGIYKFDGIDKYVYFTMYTIAAYTNIELSDDVEDDFDILSKEKILPIVIGVIKREYDDVNILLQMQCDSFIENNSVEASISRFFDDVIGILNNVESQFKLGLNKLSKIKIDENLDLSKLLSMINKN